MNNDSERRREKRVLAIYKLNIERKLSGYIIDVSKSGMKIWLHKTQAIEKENFSINVPFSGELKMSDINLDLIPVWRDENKTIHYNEIGCQFQNLDPQQRMLLDRLLALLEGYNA